jgi:HlyD family secretion protein
MSKKSSKRKVLTFVIIIIAILIVLAFAMRRHRTKQVSVPENDIPESGQDASNLYMGVVKPQKAWEIQKDADKKIKEVYVSEGDEVKNGQQLFAYDSTEDQSALSQAKIELEDLGNQLKDLNNQLTQLQNEKKSGETTGFDDIDDQINDVKNTIRQTELSQKTKQVDINNIQSRIDNSVVKSTIDGVIKHIATSSDTESTPYMTIQSSGAFRIKCRIDELNVGNIKEGMKVKVYSRVSDKTWDGTISKIDTDTKSSGSEEQSSQMMGEGEATNYDFYVNLNSSDGLIIGQHVYVEPEYEGSSYDEEAGNVTEVKGKKTGDATEVKEGTEGTDTSKEKDTKDSSDTGTEKSEDKK